MRKLRHREFKVHNYILAEPRREHICDSESIANSIISSHPRAEYEYSIKPIYLGSH